MPQRAAVPFAALALVLVAGRALAVDRIPLGAAQREAIGSTRIVGNLAQVQMGAGYEALSLPGIPGGIFGTIVSENRAREAREGAAVLDDALGDYDPRPRLKAALEQELGAIALLHGAKVEVRRARPLDAGLARALTSPGGADAVLVVDLRYGLVGLDFLVVSARVTLLPTAAATHPELKRAFGSSSQGLPVTPLYRATLLTSVPAPEDGDDLERWTADRCAPVRRAIEGGIAEVARMLAWDLGQGGPGAGATLGGGYPVPRGSAVTLRQFGEDFEAAPVQSGRGRDWYRAKGGELVSSGEAYAGVELAPFPPPVSAEAAAAAPPTKDAAGRLTFEFASADRTAQGGEVRVTQYSERPDDVELRGTRLTGGVLEVVGQVGLGKGSSWAGLGPRWALQRGRQVVDASRFRSVTFRLGATTRALRLRLVGRRSAYDEACSPVYVLEDVEEGVREYTIPLSKFQPDRACGRRGWDAKEVLPELSALEVVNARVTSKPLRLRVGATTFNP